VIGRSAQACRRRGLQDTVLASPAGVFGPDGNQDPEPGWHDVQPLTPVLADPVQLTTTAAAGLVVEVDDNLNLRQMHRQRAAVGAALVSPDLRKRFLDSDEAGRIVLLEEVLRPEPVVGAL
jgi:hypothetical protein